jgi:hypothetical protein
MTTREDNEKECMMYSITHPMSPFLKDGWKIPTLSEHEEEMKRASPSIAGAWARLKTDPDVLALFRVD